jgi:hypothetical protein
MSTAYVARDVLELVRMIDEQKQASPATGPLKLAEKTSRCMRDSLVPGNVRQAPLTAALRSRGTQPKLQYMGGSYGTFLGQTFAALYPEHVGRMVLDSNLDAENWSSRYEASVDDHEAIRDFFFEQCFQARSKCALWRACDTDRESVRDRYYGEIVAPLIDMPALLAGDGHATVLTAEELQWGFFMTLYQPHMFFAPFARFLSGIMNQSEPGMPFWHHPLPNTDALSDETLAHVLHNGEVGTAIHCSDTPDLVSFGWTYSHDLRFNTNSWTVSIRHRMFIFRSKSAGGANRKGDLIPSSHSNFVIRKGHLSASSNSGLLRGNPRG